MAAAGSVRAHRPRRRAQAVVRAAHNEGDDIGEALQEAVEHYGPVWVRDGPVDWAWLARAIIERLGTRPDRER